MRIELTPEQITERLQSIEQQLLAISQLRLSIENVAGLADALASRAKHGHAHSASDITGFALQMSKKADSSHGHELSTISGLSDQLATLANELSFKTPKLLSATAGNLATVDENGAYVDSGIVAADVCMKGHSHMIEHVDGLADALTEFALREHEHETSAELIEMLSNKADADHKHPISAIAGLKELLVDVTNRLNIKPEYSMSEIGGLMDTLTSIAKRKQKYEVADIAGLSEALEALTVLQNPQLEASLRTSLEEKANKAHSHSIAGVTGLAIALTSKADKQHEHGLETITELPGVLATKADVDHSHQVGGVAGLSELLDTKVSFDNATPYVPLGRYSPASKEYVDSKKLADLIDGTPEVGDVPTWTGKKWAAKKLEPVGAATKATKPALMKKRTVSAVGIKGDKAGMTTFDEDKYYICVANYDGKTSIWKHVPLQDIS